MALRHFPDRTSRQAAACLGLPVAESTLQADVAAIVGKNAASLTAAQQAALGGDIEDLVKRYTVVPLGPPPGRR